ncbi:MAG TPA: Do family serine endopeptidase [Thermoanaerobaculales bacterium]|nr:Do family serine endopeptidase [Thermoanaerobaculales bacterium]HQL30081.1 Do family serine endopeptidase [Thermoanaerobaculales bacterium]
MESGQLRLFSLAAVVVAAVLFGMVIAGALNVTPPATADRPPAAVAPAAAAAPLAAAGAPDFVALADQVIPSVVSVYSREVAEEGSGRGMPRDPFHFFFGPQMGPEGEDDSEPMVRRSAGSGFFISPSGEVLTNNHVVEAADKIEVQLADGTRYQVDVVGRDPATDIALLKVAQADRNFPYLALGNADRLRVGEWVMAVGNPLNMDHTVTVGVVSAKGRVLGLSDSSFENFIQTDAAINFGNSGGPLVNLRGEVVGINTAINARGQNLGFAVPIDIATRILGQLRERGRVVRGYLGLMVGPIDQETAEAFKLDTRDGAFVQEVLKGHAADKAGIRHGDVVVDIDGRRIKDTRELIDGVSAMPPGSKVTLGVKRDGTYRKITVELEERLQEGEQPDLAADEGAQDSADERVGISVAELDGRARQYWGIGEDVAGVVITRVRSVSPAAEEDLQRGDVVTEANGRAVGSVADLIAEVKRVEEGGYLRLYVFRPRAERSFYAILKLDQ